MKAMGLERPSRRAPKLRRAFKFPQDFNDEGLKLLELRVGSSFTWEHLMLLMLHSTSTEFVHKHDGVDHITCFFGRRSKRRTRRLQQQWRSMRILWRPCRSSMRSMRFERFSKLWLVPKLHEETAPPRKRQGLEPLCILQDLPRVSGCSFHP